MDVNKLAGSCLIVFGVINVLHEFVVRSTERGTPGVAYALVTATLFTLGAVLLLRKPIPHRKKANRSSTARD